MTETSDRDLPDLELGHEPRSGSSFEGPSLEGPEPPEGRSRIPWIVGGAVLLVLLLAGGWYFFLRSPAETETTPPEPVVPSASRSQPSEPTEPNLPEEDIELPPLSASDTVVRELAGRLSSHPRVVAWLASDELVRKMVAIVDNVAEGTSPRPHLQTAAPRNPFAALEENGEVVLDPEGYRRFDSVVAAFTGLDPEGTAQLYRQLQPLIQDAYRQLGYPDTDFRETLRRAMVEMLEVPVVEGKVRLEPEVSSYEYADPRLEGLSDAQKHLLRAGPDNVRRVHAQIRALARELGISPDELPETRVLRAR